ncbi:hypothetical protein EGW08_022940 [Elysia chlorotica]|uniref:Uncharacterized protein n=1 Tax=Elysia chlorotica TaxID=188477 RepID=A0A3S0ZK66_ELYCH|nr:hypothetical protein EGW08_022940 [Elysia chlorotica]
MFIFKKKFNSQTALDLDLVRNQSESCLRQAYRGINAKEEKAPPPKSTRWSPTPSHTHTETMLRFVALLAVLTLLVCTVVAQNENDFNKLATKTLQLGDLFGLLDALGGDGFDDRFIILNITKPGKK